MLRLLGIIAGAVTSFVTARSRAKRRSATGKRPVQRDDSCNADCLKIRSTFWKHLPEDDPRSPRFLSYLEKIFLQELSPEEAVESRSEHMHRAMYGHAAMLLDDLVRRHTMSAHEAEHLKRHLTATIFRTISRR